MTRRHGRQEVADHPDYRARERRREGAFARIAARLATGFAALALGACAIAIPLSPFGASEPLTTGSIGPVSPLDPALDVEDWRRARSAMAVALDPQGNGATASWENPDSGRRGKFEAASRAYARGDRVCRDFRAVLGRAGEAQERVVAGAACRVSESLWRIESVDGGAAPGGG